MSWDKIETCSSASDVLKPVNVLHAIRWVAEAWKNVNETTLKKCFCKAGFLHHLHLSVVACLVPAGSDPFSDIEQGKREDGGCAGLFTAYKDQRMPAVVYQSY